MNNESSLEQLKIRQKKNVKLILLILLGVSVLFVVTLVLVNHFLSKKEEDKVDEYIHFYNVEEGDIFENEEYLALNRSVLYCDDPSGWYGHTSEITAEDRLSFEPTVLFAEDYLIALIYGNSGALRAMCTSEYLKEHEIPEFTQQMIYEAKITYYSTEGQEDGTTLVTYRLDYKIYRNNGTYRRDVGSRTVKPEYLVLRVSNNKSEIRIHDILRS